ncbi:hypothetical protein PQX77_001285 [Marasmius sp. AFHP31]|nr:hypothetical protein PQX77_001285 [Marasmius sp. AFHP31]
MATLLSWYLLAQLILTAWAEELSVPSSWGRSTVSEASREERINRTAEAIDAFIASDALFNSTQPPSNLSDTFWPYGEFLALIADFDIFTNQTRYKRIAQERFLSPLQRTTPDLVTAIGNKFRYGYAATRAYLAYQDEGFLDIAKDYWASNRSMTVTDADVQSRSSPAKTEINSTMSMACSKYGTNYTLAGGTFHSTVQDDLGISTGSTADYLTLTVSLATVPSNLNPDYMTLASQIGHFIRTALYKGSGILYDGVRVGDPDCPSRGDNIKYSLSDAAVTVQSLSLLTLNSNNNDFTDILREVARSATGSIWNSADGVLGDLSHDSFRNSVVADEFPELPQTLGRLQRLVHSNLPNTHNDCFGAVLNWQVHFPPGIDSPLSLTKECGDQYDALVKLATFPSGVPNLYGPGFTPNGSRLDPRIQTLAITTLLGGVISSDNATTPNGSKTTDVPTTDTGRAPIETTVGGVVGGILGLALVVVAGSYYYLRRRRQMLFPPPTIDPYLTLPSVTKAAPKLPPISTSQPLWFGAPLILPNGVAESSSTSITPTSDSESWSNRMHETTTAELVMILNQRLRNERWDANESPPAYHTSI